MSQRRTRGSRVNQSQSSRLSQVVEGDSSDEGDPQFSLSSSPVNGGGEPKKNLAEDVVSYILMEDFLKKPIKQSDISKNVLKNHTTSFKHVMENATDILKKVYGLKVVELEFKSPKSFILVNNLRIKLPLHIPQSTENSMALAGIILTYIFMVSGSPEAGVDVDKVHDFLDKVGIDFDGNHRHFGNVKHLLTDLEKQQYIRKVPVPNTEPRKHEYMWGERAVVELPLKKALKFAGEMCGKDNIDAWKANYLPD